MRPFSRWFFLSHYGLSGNCLPQLAKNFAWADGHWAFYSTVHIKLSVGLLNLLLQMCFQELKWSNMRRRPGLCYRELTALPSPLTGQRGKWKEKEGRGREGMRGWERETTSNEGGWETGTGYRRQERKGKGGREGEERAAPSFSSSIHQCLQNSFILWTQEITG